MASDGSGDAVKAHSEQSDLKRKLIWRMGFASLMIVTLLGTLALFDYLTSHSEDDIAKTESTRPAPIKQKEVTQPVKIAEQPLEVGKEIKVVAEPESSAAPVDKSAQLAEPPPRPQVTAQPTLPRPIEKIESRPETRPGGRAHVQPGGVGATPAHRAPTTVAPPTMTTPQAAATPPVPSQSATPPVRTEDYPEVARPQPAPPRLFSGFTLQAGVFSDLRRAEELHAKLTLHGIPSAFEARVSAGPFKTREEADAAREKMKALGIDSVMRLPKGVRP